MSLERSNDPAERPPGASVGRGGALCGATPPAILVRAGAALVAIGCLLALPAPASAGQEHRHHAAAADPDAAVALGALAIPDVSLLDQDGNEVRFYSDLVAGKVVAINFVFTTCTTICPPMGANFARLADALGDRFGRDVTLISVSVDPVVDTPARLKAWGGRFGAGPGWTLVTGAKAEVDELLKALGVFTADKLDHSPTLLVGNDATGEWTRAHGLAAPDTLAEMVTGMITVPGPSVQATAQGEWRSPAHEYFTDVTLIDQSGGERRLFSDLLEDKVVVIQSMFTSCQASCPLLVATFRHLQERLGGRLGDDVYLLSISVDPRTDTPAVLAAYAADVGARPGWFFLTGAPDNVQLALQRLGHAVESPEGHSNVVIIGNTRTGLWKKALGLAAADDVYAVVESVINDPGRD